MEIMLYWIAIIFSIFSVGWGLTIGLSTSIANYIENKDENQ